MKINLTLKQFILLLVFLIPAFVGEAQNYNNIEFIENKGQWDARVKYKGGIDAGAIFIRAGGFTILKHNQQDFEEIKSMMHGHKENGKAANREGKIILRSHAYNVDFVGASNNLQIIPDKVIPT